MNTKTTGVDATFSSFVKALYPGSRSIESSSFLIPLKWTKKLCMNGCKLLHRFIREWESNCARNELICGNNCILIKRNALRAKKYCNLLLYYRSLCIALDLMENLFRLSFDFFSFSLSVAALSHAYGHWKLLSLHRAADGFFYEMCRRIIASRHYIQFYSIQSHTKLEDS